MRRGRLQEKGLTGITDFVKQYQRQRYHRLREYVHRRRHDRANYKRQKYDDALLRCQKTRADKADFREHELLANHITAEHWTPTTGRERIVYEWQLRPSRKENHWFDCLVGGCVAANELGCSRPEFYIKKSVHREDNFEDLFAKARETSTETKAPTDVFIDDTVPEGTQAPTHRDLQEPRSFDQPSTIDDNDPASYFE